MLCMSVVNISSSLFPILTELVFIFLMLRQIVLSSFFPFCMKDLCNGENGIKLEEEIILEAKNGDSSLISKEMAEEEQKLLEARVKEEETKRLEDSTESPKLNDNQFTKLDELLTQTQLYSEFLLEKMDDITFVCLCA